MKSFCDRNVAAPARKRISPELVRTVRVMISSDSNNKEREATDSLSAWGCPPVKECCFAGARALLWSSTALTGASSCLLFNREPLENKVDVKNQMTEIQDLGNNEGGPLTETSRSNYFGRIHKKEMFITKPEIKGKVTPVGWRIGQDSWINPLGLNYLSSAVHKDCTWVPPVGNTGCEPHHISIIMLVDFNV